jgi:hypothetical protein
MIRDVRLYNRQLTSSELVDGLVGYWAFSEGSGTSAADSSGLGNTATLSGGATWTSDCTGNNNALLTNGTGGIAQTNAQFDPPSTGTVAFWMRSTGTPAATQRILGLGGDWEIRQDNDGLVVSDLCGDGSTNIGTVTPLTTVGTWYHFAATFDSTNNSYAIYVNGQLERSGINPVTLSKQAAGVLSFGVRTSTTDYWNGALRDVRVYNRKLCPIEIEQLYGLNGYWKLDETSGSTAADSSGMGRNGTVVGTPTWSAGAMSNALTVNSTTYLSVPSLLDTPKNVTLAAWGNLTGIDTNGAELVSLGNYIAIRLDEAGATKMFYYNGSGWNSVSTSQTFLNKGWHHFAAVFNDDQNSAQLYIDGVLAASATTTVTIPYAGSGTSFIVGRHGNGSAGWNMTGKVDDVRVYSRALCPSDILALKNAGRPFNGVKIVKWVEIQ